MQQAARDVRGAVSGRSWRDAHSEERLEESIKDSDGGRLKKSICLNVSQRLNVLLCDLSHDELGCCILRLTNSRISLGLAIAKTAATFSEVT